MPSGLYLVRWPDRSVWLLTARDEQHLMEIVDAAGDATRVWFRRWDGPVAIGFAPPEVRDRAEAVTTMPLLRLPLRQEGIDRTEEFWTMQDAIARSAFPRLFAALQDARERALTRRPRASGPLVERHAVDDVATIPGEGWKPGYVPPFDPDDLEPEPR